MNRLSTPRLACFAVLALASSLAQAAKPVTIESLLHEMVDREALARFPAPAYVGKQASSYDRDSVSPDDRKSWFANMDRSQFVRIEERNGKKEYVMMDEQGPGAIVHLWATWHGPHGGPFSDGLLRVYIDGNDKPAIEGKASEVIDKGLLTGAPLSEGVSPKTGTQVTQDPDASIDTWITGGLQFTNGAAYSYVVLVGTGSVREPFARKLHAADMTPLAEMLLAELESHAKANPEPKLLPPRPAPSSPAAAGPAAAGNTQSAQRRIQSGRVSSPADLVQRSLSLQ